MSTSNLLQFLGVVALITVMPGPDTVLVVRHSMRHGFSRGLLTACGCTAGLLLWGIATAVGLLVIVRASSALFAAVRVAGACYLLVLGVALLARGSRTLPSAGSRHVGAGAGRSAIGRRYAFAQGMLADLLNPKAAAFFTSLLPQFVSPGENVMFATLALAAVAACAALMGLSGYAWCAARATGAFVYGRGTLVLDKLSGCVLVCLGVRMLAGGTR